jgi:transcriptional regulator with XRE-family HTH domain
MEFKTNLGKLLEMKGITPYKIGKETNVSKQSIMNYLQGKSMPTGEALITLSAYLDTSADYLLGISKIEFQLGNYSNLKERSEFEYTEKFKSILDKKNNRIIELLEELDAVKTELFELKMEALERKSNVVIDTDNSVAAV